MVKFIRTWWHESRVVRKFRNDRVALFSLSIIGTFSVMFFITVITPLKTDYVNLQERKANEYKENQASLKDTMRKSERLQKEIDAILSATKPIQKVARASAPSVRRSVPKARTAQPSKKKSPKSSVTSVVPKPAVTPIPKEVQLAMLKLHLQQQARLVAHGKKLLAQHQNIQKQWAQLNAQARTIQAQKATLSRQKTAIKKLRKVAILQKQVGEIQSEILLLRVKLQQPPPAALNWLQRYNQDTGQAFAKPFWWRANTKEQAIIQTLSPYVLVGGESWVKEVVLSHDRRGLLGSDRLGRDIFKRTLVSINVAFKIGLVTALIACFIGLILGGIAGFFGGWLDLLITWLYSVFSSIPYIVLVLLIAAMTRDQPGLISLYIAFGLTFWIGPARVVRGEVMKIKQMEYVQAARALGNSPFRILVKHILPNTMYLIFVYFSLIFIGAIKSEVILTFLGLGVKGMPSWGSMISDASKEIIGGFWWQMLGASFALFLLVYAFNIFTDALQDALDPKHTK